MDDKRNAAFFGKHALERAIALLFGQDARIASKRPVYGGDINEAYRLSLSDGSAVFIKCNTLENLSFFEAEARGLNALRRAGTIGVPQVLGMGADEEKGFSFLLMEYLEAAPRSSQYWEIFGRELAALHCADCSGLTGADGSLLFGFAEDNYIGASLQINMPMDSWIAFFRECRLLPQIRMAEGYLDSRMHRQFGKLLDHLDCYLVEPKAPSLLHGDLWSGNAVCGPDGKAWILDPAAYVGHFEAELGMTELFGGYPAAFYQAYREVNPIDSGYRDRRELYNLYHLLNHLNLFGSSYRGSVEKILNRYI